MQHSDLSPEALFGDEQIDTLAQQVKEHTTGEPPTPPPDQRPV